MGSRSKDERSKDERLRQLQEQERARRQAEADRKIREIDERAHTLSEAWTAYLEEEKRAGWPNATILRVKQLRQTGLLRKRTYWVDEETIGYRADYKTRWESSGYPDGKGGFTGRRSGMSVAERFFVETDGVIHRFRQSDYDRRQASEWLRCGTISECAEQAKRGLSTGGAIFYLPMPPTHQ